MQSKTIFIVVTVFALALPASAIGRERGSARRADTIQSKKADDRALPKQLSETEVQLILKETSPKSHVEASLKISDARLANAIKNASAEEYKTAVEEVDVYASLVIYANDYTRKLPDSQIKDRNNCLKKIEQAIFKQNRNLDIVSRDIPFDYREPVMEKISQVKKIRLRVLDDLLGGGKFINSSNER
ncbi:MAG: hypothetical protein ACKVZH_01880 [Blastocatellia bacterium]